MKILNVLVSVLLVALNAVLLYKYGLNNDSLFIISLAVLCIFIFLLGIICPNKIVKSILNFLKKIYKNSDTINPPVEIEAKRTFLNRLKYILFLANILLSLSIVSILF